MLNRSNWQRSANQYLRFESQLLQGNSLIRAIQIGPCLRQVAVKPACRTSLFAVRPDPCEDALRRAK